MSDQCEENNDLNISDNQEKLESSNLSNNEENIHDENLREDLDFYDFLEAVSDEIDTITDQIEVEHRSEGSRHPLRRTLDELKQKRRVLKNKLQKRIHLWSENFKRPNFIRSRDKISFTIGVSNACFSPLIAGRWPHILPTVYTIQALFLITLRFFIYKRKSWHYFVYDLCYFVNLLTLIYLWIFPSSTVLFIVCYALSHGPIGLAIVFWRNSLVFHSLDKVTSLFIHMYPPLTLFTLRWLLPVDMQRQLYPAIAEIGPSIPLKLGVFYSVIFYLLWQLLYYAFIVYGRREKVARGLRATSYSWLLADKNGFVARVIDMCSFQAAPDGTDRYKILIYFFLQFAYMLLSILPACIWYYSNMYANVVFLCSIFAVSVYNGASFYIDVFSKRYIASLELLQDMDDLERHESTDLPTNAQNDSSNSNLEAKLKSS